jgi:Uma2 family endonuclease
MGTIVSPPRTMLEVYRSLPEGTLCQLINNQIIMSPAPLDIHQKILDKLYRLLGNFVEKNNLGETRVAPYDVYFSVRNVYQPDIIFISNENSINIQKDGLHGAPDLIIEVLSPSTAKYDLEDKKDCYERYGVKEYWIVDPATKSTQGYALEKNEFILLATATGEIKSSLLNTSFTF